MPVPCNPEGKNPPPADEIEAFLRSLLRNPDSGEDSPRRPSLHELGITPLARQLGLADEQTNGHWCSRCEGIWYGYTLEVECPVCGNRKG